MNLAPYAKAITALVVSFAATWVAQAGVALDATQTEVLASTLSALVTAFFTWAIPNTPTRRTERV